MPGWGWTQVRRHDVRDGLTAVLNELSIGNLKRPGLMLFQVGPFAFFRGRLRTVRLLVRSTRTNPNAL